MSRAKQKVPVIALAAVAAADLVVVTSNKPLPVWMTTIQIGVIWVYPYGGITAGPIDSQLRRL